MMFRLTAIAAAATIATTATAGIAPYTETFADGAANWYDQAGTSVLDWVSVGGADSGGYVTTDYNFVDDGPGFPPVLFRGQANFGSSGNAFVGDWLSGGITEFSFFIRHNASEPLQFFARIAPAANFPSVNAVTTEFIAPGQWTQVAFAIEEDNPEFTYGGPPGTFDTVFSDVGNIQIGALAGDLAGVDEVFTFDLDLVSIAVPTPGALALFGVAGLVGYRRRRG